MKKKAWIGSMAMTGLLVLVSLASQADMIPYGSYGGYSRFGSYGGYGGYGGSRSAPIVSLDLDEKNLLNSSFRIAAREGRTDSVEKAIHQGADVNSRSDEGETALIYASRNCSEKMTKLLLDLRANVNVRDSVGRSAIFYSVMDSCEPVTRLLLSRGGVELESKDRTGKTVFDYAEEASITEVDGPSYETLKLLDQAKKDEIARKQAMRKRPVGERKQRG